MYEAFGKRLFDLLLVVIAVLLLGPLMFVISLLIKICDPGPVFFCQQRVGRDGELFMFYKFRSMPVNTGNLPSDKIGSVELTWIGRLIRRTNLDELPQLFNVVLGDMSIVGPRPPIPNQHELVDLREKNGSLRKAPGLTGLAQIKSFDGMSVEEKANFDGIYASDVSFVNDICIILKTFIYLLKPPPVY